MTMQMRDKLMYDNQLYYLNDEILEKFFHTFPDKKPKIKGMCTALWCGYLATFEIKENQLFVQDFTMLESIETLGSEISILDNLFPNEHKYDWFSGLIRIDEYRGYFDEEKSDHIFQYLEILKGNFIRQRTMNYQELQIFKQLQFEYFKLSESYEKVFSLWKNNNPQLTTKQIKQIDAYLLQDIMRLSEEIYVD